MNLIFDISGEAIAFEMNYIFDISGEAIAAKDSSWTLFIRRRVFKGKRKIAIESNCWKMTTPDNNQPLIRVYTHKNMTRSGN